MNFSRRYPIFSSRPHLRRYETLFLCILMRSRLMGLLTNGFRELWPTRTGSRPEKMSVSRKLSSHLAVYCPYPGAIEHGRVLLVGNMGMYDYRPYVRRVRNNRQITYECKRGYVLEHNAPVGATCVDGQWSPSQLPQCTPGEFASNHFSFLRLLIHTRPTASLSRLTQYISRDSRPERRKLPRMFAVPEAVREVHTFHCWLCCFHLPFPYRDVAHSSVHPIPRMRTKLWERKKNPCHQRAIAPPPPGHSGMSEGQ